VLVVSSNMGVAKKNGLMLNSITKSSSMQPLTTKRKSTKISRPQHKSRAKEISSSNLSISIKNPNRLWSTKEGYSKTVNHHLSKIQNILRSLATLNHFIKIFFETNTKNRNPVDKSFRYLTRTRIISI